MKNFKFFTLFVFLISVSFNSYSQLNKEAKALKEKLPKTYEGIKKSSQDNWGGDHAMILFEINEQSKAFIEFVKWGDTLDTNKNKEEFKIVDNALIKWTKDPLKAMETGEGDWSMIRFEIQYQLKAMSEY